MLCMNRKDSGQTSETTPRVGFQQDRTTSNPGSPRFFILIFANHCLQRGQRCCLRGQGLRLCRLQTLCRCGRAWRNVVLFAEGLRVLIAKPAARVLVVTAAVGEEEVRSPCAVPRPWDVTWGSLLLPTELREPQRGCGHALHFKLELGEM